MFCDICGVWLNGWDQFQEHARSRKHRKKGRQSTNRHNWSSLDAAAVTVADAAPTSLAVDPAE
eukprot:7893751-Lingulodinium_polyedra.AAC.1